MLEISVLRRCMLFAGLADDDLAKIARTAVVKQFEKRNIIFSEGDRAAGFYVLLSGMVKIYRISPDSREQILHIISPNETFAEAAIFIGKTYPAFAEAILDSSALYLDKEQFLKMLGENPRLSLNIIISLSMMLKKVVDLVDNVALKNVDVRLAEHLLEQAVRLGRKVSGGVEFDLDISKGELAKKIGTVNETLSRVFRKLRDGGIITVDRNRIIVHSLEALQKIKEEARFHPSKL